ncbi:3'-to-5' exoribonuclease RNase R [Candidatus Syntrophocurvum alkaliphilum]|uniref:Ribonuclease R n=1 Tax=Candidatus Syntrophocurvum alkaliphilum TaxID=2293317 RepID=A0A6I6DMV4_9FIRM|nr:ribonuclease R [Candidatus Syntrophocurvum alkaliphilum]QGU00348.1 3'-to-5' exoribonuclease RNase R [Candidatus Syntrophocurvum alkaliphilum]
MRDASYRPLAYNELMEVLKVHSYEDEMKFSKLIGKLEKEGEIVRTRKEKFGLPEMMNLVKGVIKLSQRGYGIVDADDPTHQPSVFVYGKNLNGAMHLDKVMVRIHQKATADQRPEGEVIRVITRANTQLVGTFEKGKHAVQVIPDDSRQIYPIYVKPSKKLNVKNGDKVLVNITEWPDKYKFPAGKIVEVFGRKGTPGLDVQVIIKKHNLAEDFPPGVIEEAKKVAKPITDEEITNRTDLRDIKMVTIDGEDAKDLDDAVSIAKTDKGYRLGVHIADVSYYVRQGSKLDKEAFQRGTSVYLINKVLPMLPKELSNDICSLNANDNRLAMSCIMEIDYKGKVLNYDLCKSVINIDERMTYTDVNKILAKEDKELEKRYSDLVEDFFLMKELSEIIREQRMARGALDFDFPESKVILDDNNVPIEIKRFERGISEMIIEDFMIQANEVVAEHMYWQELPILYRVHEKPDEEALTKLNAVLGVFGQKITSNKVEPHTFQKVLNDIKGSAGEKTMALMLLRSMKHAKYVPDALGHFGLASKYYCHFTSPIRRYPDLIVHRVLSATLDGKMTGKKRASFEKRMANYGEQSSLKEIKAEEAERELVDIKKAQYMEQFIGEEFEATISSVQPFGLFVELDNTIEGLVHISSIEDDYYEFIDRSYSLIGSHTGRKFSIGDKVRVRLVKVDADDAKIDFELSE